MIDSASRGKLRADFLLVSRWLPPEKLNDNQAGLARTISGSTVAVVLDGLGLDDVARSGKDGQSA